MLTTLPKEIKLDGATAVFRDDGILHIHYESVLMSLDEAKAIIEGIREVSPWREAPTYISAEPFAAHEDDAQNYLASDEVMQYCTGVAILVRNVAQRIAINFFIKLKKPSKPTKFFTSEEEALKWLQQFETIA